MLALITQRDEAVVTLVACEDDHPTHASLICTACVFFFVNEVGVVPSIPYIVHTDGENFIAIIYGQTQPT